jgi:hypothetical protein
MRYSIGDDEIVAADDDDVYSDMLLALSGDDDDDELSGDYFDEDDLAMAGEEIIGIDEIIGADTRAKRVRLAKAAQAKKKNRATSALKKKYAKALKQLSQLKKVAAARAAGGVVLRRTGPNNPPRDQILPVGPQAYLAAQTADVVMIPQRTFRPQRLVFSSLITPFFTMNSLLVGQDPQFVAGGSVPLEVLSQVGVGVGITGTTANLGNTVTIGLTNLDVVNPQTVRGAIFGVTVY